MDTARITQQQPCLVFLHPAAANSPDKVREIYNATGLVAVAGLNSHAAELIPAGTRSPDPFTPGPNGGGAAA